MADAKIVTRKIEVEVVLEEKEYEAMREFIRAYGSVRPSKAGEWQKADGFPLWEKANRVLRDADRAIMAARR